MPDERYARPVSGEIMTAPVTGTAAAEPLAPGAAFVFSSRLEAPKEGIRSVSVTFQE